MRRPWRARLSAAERRELWWRWRQGESLCAIGRALDRFPTTLNREVRARGGFPPPERTRKPRHLFLAEREEISRGLGAGLTRTRIAARLGRSGSTVCREVARNGGARAYRATGADSHAWDRAARPQACKLSRNGRLRRTVAAKLCLQWSPEQIAADEVPADLADWWTRFSHANEEERERLISVSSRTEAAEGPVRKRRRRSRGKGGARPEGADTGIRTNEA